MFLDVFCSGYFELLMIVASKTLKGLSIWSNIFCKANIAYTSAYQGSRSISFRKILQS